MKSNVKILRLFFFIIVILFWATYDAIAFTNFDWYNGSHNIITLIRILGWLLLDFLIGDNIFKTKKPHFLLAAGFFWVALFDQTLNLMRGRDFLYLGGQAKWDLFWIDNEGILMAVKGAALILALFITFKNQEHVNKRS